MSSRKRSSVRSAAEVEGSRKYPNWTEVVERAPESFPHGFKTSMVSRLPGHVELGSGRRRERTQVGSTNKAALRLQQGSTFHAGLTTSSFGFEPEPGTIPDPGRLAKRQVDMWQRGDAPPMQAAEDGRRAAAAAAKRFWDRERSQREHPIDHPNLDPDVVDYNPPVAVLSRQPRRLPDAAATLSSIQDGSFMDSLRSLGEPPSDGPLMRSLPPTKRPDARLPQLDHSIGGEGLSFTASAKHLDSSAREAKTSTIGPDTCDSAVLSTLRDHYSDAERERKSFREPQFAARIVAQTRLGATKYSQTMHLTQNGPHSAGFAADVERFSERSRGLDTTWQREERNFHCATQALKLGRRRENEQRVLGSYQAGEDKAHRAADARAAGRARTRQIYHDLVRAEENHRSRVPTKTVGVSPPVSAIATPASAAQQAAPPAALEPSPPSRPSPVATPA
eukprot:TRINITY_DN71041_c0_g1_i1.p1 TRINITY_DN71041_c0_g1~~TRINITY_DN71041_c0_g1_i1.p1  ORF type:complete len:477 (+),score=118.71 TRINITY_DN71041_c0_g1_i1:85-1431(+)